MEIIMKQQIVQGGMGVYISTPFLANTVSINGGLGTVSGTAADRIMARILQNGDPGSHFRRALAHFPFQDVAQQVIDAYYVEGGIPKGTPYKTVPAFTLTPLRSLIALVVCANFALVWLAKEGHTKPVSINYLEKIRLPHIYSFVGAMLAGDHCISMGAGIPFQVPGVLDSIAEGRIPSYRITIDGNQNGTVTLNFDPRGYFRKPLPGLKRPAFLPIVSSHVLASLLLKKASGSVQGFIVEAPTAGGHNAPPRGNFKLDDKGQPVYGQRDKVDFAKMASFGLPFWIGGSYASPQSLVWARASGARGVQVGSIFALCEESGMDDQIKREIKRQGFHGQLRVRTDVRASPAGFPFKVAILDGTLSDDSVYEARKRVCNQYGLRTPYQKPDGSIAFRCPAENVNQYVHKGGKLEDTEGVRCLCNGLLSTAGFGNPNEPAIITLGDDVSFLRHLMRDEDDSYTAAQVMKYLLGDRDSLVPSS